MARARKRDVKMPTVTIGIYSHTRDDLTVICNEMNKSMADVIDLLFGPIITAKAVEITTRHQENRIRRMNRSNGTPEVDSTNQKADRRRSG